MNMNQFTQKSLAAIQGAQDIALEHGNQQIEQPHLLLALVEESDEVDGLLVLLNTVGGDIEAGLCIAEMIAGMTKQIGRAHV